MLTPVCSIFVQAACETFDVSGKDHIEIPKLYTSNVTWDPHHYRLTQDSEPLDLNRGTASLHHAELVCPSCGGGRV